MKLGESGRYQVIDKLGDGTFGRVLACKDRALGIRVAVKVIRDVKRYVENARVEARILDKVNEIRRLSGDRSGARGIVRLFDTFMHASRFCLSFECLGKTLFEVVQMNNHAGFYEFDIQQISRELLETIEFLHSRCGLTHTDIKLENIMLCGTSFLTTCAPLRTGRAGTNYMRPKLLGEESFGRHRSIRLIDFGNGVFRNEHHSTTINTRQYRSPEVILEQGWDEKSDMWSIGCVIAEMWTGELLFPTHANLEHLAMIERVTETPLGPETLRSASPEIRRRYADCNNMLNWPQGCDSRESFLRVNDCMPLRCMFDRNLAELVSKLLRVDPRRRYSGHRALQCEYFDAQLPFSDFK